MKQKDLKELQQKTYEELARQVKDSKVNLAKMELDLVMGKSSNTAGVRELRRDIARISTIMHMRLLESTVKEENNG